MPNDANNPVALASPVLLPTQRQDAPLYNVNDLVFVAESAALGFLESYRVQTVQNSGGGWVYTIRQSEPTPAHRPPLLGERISGRRQFVRYFREEELVDQCTALRAVISTLETRLAQARQLYANLCPTPPNPTAV